MTDGGGGSIDPGVIDGNVDCDGGDGTVILVDTPGVAGRIDVGVIVDTPPCRLDGEGGNIVGVTD